MEIDIDKIKECILNINSILNHKLLNNIKFDELTKKISDKKLVNFYYDFFSIIFNNEFNQKDTKILLSSYVTHLFNDIVSSPKNSYDKIIKNISKLIYEQHTILFDGKDINIENISKLNKLYSDYIILFKKWIQKDKIVIIDDLIRMYFENIELENVSHQNPEYIKIVKEHAEKEKKNILSKIKQIGGEKGIEYFNQQKNNIETIQEHYNKLFEAIEKNTTKAYWDIVKEKLEKNPPELDIILELIKEIQLMLCQCVPSRKDLHINILQEIDIEYIKHLIDNKCMDDREIVIQISKIISWIEKFNSKQDKDFYDWKKKIEKELDEYGLDYFQFNINISEFIPRVFKYSLEKINEIIINSEKFKQTEMYNILKQSKLNEHNSNKH